ncbi:aspartic proteinase nepenthesin-1 isoform X3 [Physcomitrium patens]|uniref:aspartic proteinase nepenthesin-1 isoform X3 n=1 Tax=Physcomitrium patens TaxID=3218 RepID=UPI003CCCC875
MLCSALVLRTELIHREHPSSPLRSNTSKTTTEIFLAAVKRGAERRAQLSKHILAEGRLFSTPVASGNGEYLIDISFGSPPQKASVIVDTGSDLIWTQCLPCETCNAAASVIFDPVKSSTYDTVSCASNFCSSLPFQSCTTSCKYDYMYGDGSSTSGALSTETVTVGTGTIPNVAFGCGHTNLGSFAGAAGIVGLGQGPLSLISQASSITSKKFSYCLVPLGSTKTSPMLIGDSAAAGGVAYTALLTNTANPTFYYADLTGISVSGKAVTYPVGTFSIDASGQGGFILDSGTTLTYLETGAFNALVAALKAEVPFPEADGSLYGLDYCFSTAGVANPTYPTMTFHFKGADYELPPENVFVALDTGGSICLAMAASTGFSIMGNIQQQNHLIVHDLVNQRVGFKEANCETI